MKKKLNFKSKPLLFILLIFIVVPVGITFSKYVKNYIKYFLMEANDFYFMSDKLGETTISYEINNWSGVDNFVIQFQLNNHKNNILTSDSDITYSVNATCSSGVTCTLSNTSGTIYKNEKTDNLSITVIPQRAFDTDEEVSVYIEANSSNPYEKKLSATFKIKVGKKGISYEIKDEVNQPYMDLIITNALDEYKVITAFDSYHVGDIISSEVYKNLSDDKKAKCYSANISISFNPNNILIDVTNNIIKSSTTTTTLVNGINYISSINFKVESMSSNQIRFYKQDISKDYTYPFGSEEVVTFTAS